MAILGASICDNIIPNQGQEDCVIKSGIKNRVIFLPDGYTTDAAFWATPETSLKALLLNDNQKLRAYATPRFHELTPQEIEVALETAADNSQFLLKEGSTTYQFMLKDSNTCAQKALLGFDGNKGNIWWVQNNRTILGKKVAGSSSPYSDLMGGFKPQRVYVPKASEATYSATSASQLHIHMLTPKQDQASTIGAVLSDIDLDALLDKYQITNAKIVLSATPTTTGVVKFKIFSGCGQVNLGLPSNYGSELNSASLWTFVNGSTSGTLAKTLAWNNVTGEYTMTATTPPATGTPLVIGLAAVSVLEAAGVTYYETPATRFDGTITPTAETYKLTVLNA